MRKVIIGSDNRVLSIIEDSVFLNNNIAYAEQNTVVTVSDEESENIIVGMRYINGKTLLDPTKGVVDILGQAAIYIQKRLDSLAVSWGYDNIGSAVSYVGDPNTKYNQEATVLRNWRSETWAALESTTSSGESLNSLEDVIKNLPAIPQKPVTKYSVSQ